MRTRPSLPPTALEATAAGSPPILMLLVDLTAALTSRALRRRAPTDL